ncbi:MAG TPA: hypothetical protein ENH99_00740 [Candidatus Pacearchaeota archaeon]|nr:hypothetical protein [Candidatus Pacearchaeota archaeon]
MINEDREEELEKNGADAHEMIKSSLRARLGPGCVVDFNDVDPFETLVVESVGEKRVMVYGRYYDASGVTRRRMSFDTIARRIDLVGYMQKPLAEY